jgi:hypothetical protein
VTALHHALIGVYASLNHDPGSQGASLTGDGNSGGGSGGDLWFMWFGDGGGSGSRVKLGEAAAAGFVWPV